MNKKLLLGIGLSCLLLMMSESVFAQQKTADEEAFDSYLFAFFSDNSPYGEQIRYALSDDGYNYRALNDGRPVVSSDSIARKRSIRDPYIMRGQDGKTFYMVLTDMRSSEGWQSNDGLVLMKSTDLLHWQHTAIHFPERFPDLKGFDEKNLHAVWAPQTIWDEKEQKYMIYYSIGRHDWEYPTDDPRFNQPYFKIFYSYANEDFTDVTEPKLLFDFGTASIDGDIVYDQKNQEYVLFFKDEGRSVMNKGFRTRQGVMRATSKNLTGPYTVEYRHLQKEGQYPVEGSSVFPLIGCDEFVLMYDCYANGYYQFCKSSDLKNFTFVQNTLTRGNFTPRHGSVMHITRAERERLEAWDDLQTSLDELRSIPIPAYTLKQLDERKKVMEEAKQTLATGTTKKEFLKASKKVRKFVNRF